MVRKFAMGTLLILMVSLLNACATTQKQSTGAEAAKNDSTELPPGGQIANSGEPSDPFEHFNESMLTFNRKADDWVLHPAATGYSHVVPQPARASVGRFFENVGVIPRFANDVFQGQFKQAGV